METEKIAWWSTRINCRTEATQFRSASVYCMTSRLGVYMVNVDMQEIVLFREV